MNTLHAKKAIAPIIITVLAVLQVSFTLRVWQIASLSTTVKVAMTALCLALIATLIYLLIERIKEIRSGEEDDLSKY